MVADWPGMPEAAVTLATRVLDYDRACREAKATVEGFFEERQGTSQALERTLR